ncbi:hypothetical protein CDCA_CDCA05G1606 [Cyanidium caldarium]|uniref:Inositol-1-monophosphatase n=1 Tax=Cyanidium caldarium TaxID=2771 RepID=A0AAV9ITT1_CYACA|nr:hypothetical protein CDCA_CDCA05G1606 [Cyanidium caldarium]
MGARCAPLPRAPAPRTGAAPQSRAHAGVLPAVHHVAEWVISWFGFAPGTDDELLNEATAAALAVVAGGSLVKVALESGRSADGGRTLMVQRKGNSADLVTQVDCEAEKKMREILLGAFPAYGFLGEEASSSTISSESADAGAAAEAPPRPQVLERRGGQPEKPVWIVDPLDGTTNFVARIPQICTSVGLYYQGAVLVGAVHNPCTDDLYMAVRGRGAVLNGHPLKCDTVRAMEEAVVVTEFGYDRSRIGAQRMCGAVERLLRSGVRAVRMLGSGILDILYVAEGRIAAVYAGVAGEGWRPWDHAASTLIAQEAGAVVVPLRAGDAACAGPPSGLFDIFSDSILCACTAELATALGAIVLDADGCRGALDERDT